jgi:hypothetical protein
VSNLNIPGIGKITTLGGARHYRQTTFPASYKGPAFDRAWDHADRDHVVLGHPKTSSNGIFWRLCSSAQRSIAAAGDRLGQRLSDE